MKHPKNAVALKSYLNEKEVTSDTLLIQNSLTDQEISEYIKQLKSLLEKHRCDAVIVGSEINEYRMDIVSKFIYEIRSQLNQTMIILIHSSEIPYKDRPHLVYHGGSEFRVLQNHDFIDQPISNLDDILNFLDC